MSNLHNFFILRSRFINFFTDKDLFYFDLFPSFKQCKLAEDGIILGIYFCFAESVVLLPAVFFSTLSALVTLAVTKDVFATNLFQSYSLELCLMYNRSCSPFILN